MVGPSLSEEDQARQRTRLKVVLACIVGASGGTVAFANGGSLPLVVGATVGGLIVGAALVWYISSIAPDSGI